jgi:hypothetical protein
MVRILTDCLQFRLDSTPQTPHRRYLIIFELEPSAAVEINLSLCLEYQKGARPRKGLIGKVHLQSASRCRANMNAFPSSDSSG